MKIEDILRPEHYIRDDDRPDSVFYGKARFVNHLDSLALSTVEELYARLITKCSCILDLMASHDSHLRTKIEPSAVVGLGLNQEELDANPVLTQRVLHDLNAEPLLPFEEAEFDAVINTVSIDYMIHPVEVFREVSRILKPQGVFIVVFSNRMFPPKAVHIWKTANESERIDLVKAYFRLAGGISIEGSLESKGKPRPKDDKYYSYGIPSDPIYAIWAKKKGNAQ